jgi:hypothetical protein
VAALGHGIWQAHDDVYEKAARDLSLESQSREHAEKLIDTYRLAVEPRKGRVRTWADLMYWESVVMVSTMVDLMRDHGISSLAVHDSLIVPQSATNIAAAALKDHFRSVTQREVQVTIHPKGLIGS